MLRLLALLMIIGFGSDLCQAGTGVWFQDDFDDGILDPVWTEGGTGSVTETDGILEIVGVPNCWIRAETENLRVNSTTVRMRPMSGTGGYVSFASVVDGFSADVIVFQLASGPDDIAVNYFRDSQYLGIRRHSYPLEYGNWYDLEVDLQFDRYKITINGTEIEFGYEFGFTGDRFNQAFLGSSSSRDQFDDLTVYVTDMNADLAVTTTCSESQVGTGDTVPYEITVTNLGPGDATSVVVEDQLPSGTSLILATPEQGSCQMIGAILTCDLGSIDTGDSVKVMVDLSLDEIILGNSAVVRAAQFDGDQDNNTGGVETPIACEPVSSTPIPTARVGNQRLLNHPNPFKPKTTIAFQLKSSGFVDLSIYDAAGRHVRTLLREDTVAGEHQLDWDGKDDAGREIASGSYFYELSLDGRPIDSNRAVHLK